MGMCFAGDKFRAARRIVYSIRPYTDGCNTVCKQPQPVPYTRDPRELTVRYGRQGQFTSAAAWGYSDTDEVRGREVDNLQAVCEQGKPFEASSCRQKRRLRSSSRKVPRCENLSSENAQGTGEARTPVHWRRC